MQKLKDRLRAEYHFSFKQIGAVAGTIGVSVALDQWSKVWAIAELYHKPTRTYLNGMIKLLYAENTGAWGSMGSGLAEPYKFWLLTVLPIVFLSGLFLFNVARKDLKTYEIFCYALIVGGGAGNLIDRAIHGFVVDFLWVGYGAIGTNIFNIADVEIMTGVIVLFLVQLIHRK